MSEPITLTERERAHRALLVLRALANTDWWDWLPRKSLWLAFQEFKGQPAESASPPRVPGASAHPRQVGVESGPGQPTEYERGRRAGIEAAIGEMRTQAAQDPGFEKTRFVQAVELRIRALAAAPPVDERARCLEIVRRHIDAKVHATFGPNATLQDAFALGCELTAGAIYDDIGGTQKFSKPIDNVDGEIASRTGEQA